jgi:probable DNA metabolism protein
MEKTKITKIRDRIENHLGATCSLKRDFSHRLFFAKKHKDFNNNKIEQIYTQDLDFVLSDTTKEAKLLSNWSRQVLKDIHRVKMFTRFEISDKGVLYSKINTEHNIEEYALDFFIERFQKYTIIIESKNNCFLGSKLKKEFYENTTCEQLLKKIKQSNNKDKILSELKPFSKEIWNKFYEGQYIKERKNSKYFFQNMPKKMQNNYEMNYEKKLFSESKTLIDFGFKPAKT